MCTTSTTVTVATCDRQPIQAFEIVPRRLESIPSDVLPHVSVFLIFRYSESELCTPQLQRYRAGSVDRHVHMVNIIPQSMYYQTIAKNCGKDVRDGAVVPFECGCF